MKASPSGGRRNLTLLVLLVLAVLVAGCGSHRSGGTAATIGPSSTAAPSSPRLALTAPADTPPVTTLNAQEAKLVAAMTAVDNAAKVMKNAGGVKSLANAQGDIAMAETDNGLLEGDLTPPTPTTTTATTATTTTTTAAPTSDLYVSASAPSGGSGSQSAPFQTITQCAAAVTAGSTCWIESGTYSDKNVCPAHAGSSPISMVTIEAYPGESPIMNGGGASADAFMCSGKNYVRISGMTITNYRPPDEVGADGSGAITFGNSVGPEIDHDTIGDISSSNQDAGIFIYNTSTTQAPFTILDNQVSGVTESGVANGEQDDIWVAAGDYYSGGLIQGNVVSGAGKDGIRVECGTHTSTIAVEDNIAAHNTADGIQVNNCYATSSVLIQNNFIGWTTNENLMVKHSQNVTIANNTSVQPTTGVTDCGGFNCLNASDGLQILGENPFGGTGGDGTVDGGNWNLTVKNNIFYGGNGLEVGSGDYAVIKANDGTINYDDWYGWANYMAYVDEHVTGNGGYDYFDTLIAFTASTGYETNGLSDKPLFTDPSAGNYTLQPGSPLIGRSSTGGNPGADPSHLVGVGPTGAYGLANTSIS